MWETVHLEQGQLGQRSAMVSVTLGTCKALIFRLCQHDAVEIIRIGNKFVMACQATVSHSCIFPGSRVASGTLVFDLGMGFDPANNFATGLSIEITWAEHGAPPGVCDTRDEQ